MNLPTGKAKKAYVSRMFTGLSGNYDLVNSLCSLFIDHSWRIRAVKALGKVSGERILDLCAGTLPLSRAFLKRAKGNIVAVDISAGMLQTGMHRLRPRYSTDRLGGICGDAELLPLQDQTCDGAMMAFGIRNLADLIRGFTELHRVMRPGARIVILEFSRPENALFAYAYRLYLKWILVPVGTLITGDRHAYQYLVKSIETFPHPEEVANKLRKTGFRDVTVTPLTVGIVTLYKAQRA